MQSPSREQAALKQAAWLLPAIILGAAALQTMMGDWLLAQNFFSQSTWQSCVKTLRGEIVANQSGELFANVPYLSSLVWVACFYIACVTICGLIDTIQQKTFRQQAFLVAAQKVGLWGMFCGGWFLAWLVSILSGSVFLIQVVLATLPFWVAITIAGILFEIISLIMLSCSSSKSSSNSRLMKVPTFIWAAVAIYVLIFTAMNWGLWFNLRLPHGDSSMYEEHLWNVLHGKGFRSYLDQGLFLGEHIQVIHLLLTPVYALLPSHLTLEFCESLALAAGAIPVYWMTARQTSSKQAAIGLAVCYLFYFPMQFLDIAVDLKTFRPTAFGVPALLFALDQLDRKRYTTMAILLLIAVSAKEEYSILVCLLGIWMLVTIFWTHWSWTHWQQNRKQTIEKQSLEEAALNTPILWKLPALRWGMVLALFGPIYLKLALSIIVWFRSGVEVHYANYYSKFGGSMSEVIWTMLTNPTLLAGEFSTLESLIYALAVLIPMGGLALFSPSRLVIVAGPFFMLLCLNELDKTPRHHFHAPLIPILFWAAAHGMQPLATCLRSLFNKMNTVEDTVDENNAAQSPLLPKLGMWAASCAIATGVFFSLSPASITFWDAGSSKHWQKLYVQSERAKQFGKIFPLIPPTARVASTDFIHPRFTHHRRSYDLSHYKRKVTGKEQLVPADTDFVVIDMKHPYSIDEAPQWVNAFREQPDQWKQIPVPNPASRFFVVFERTAFKRKIRAIQKE